MARSRRRKGQEPREEPLVAEEQIFRHKRAQLLRRYEGQFVALSGGRVIGHGMDNEELAQRMFERFGDVPFFIAKVEREPSIYELPSPEVVG
jgi:Family of unknown function (DUF5678)